LHLEEKTAGFISAVFFWIGYADAYISPKKNW
jgi:hypothetical protein